MFRQVSDGFQTGFGQDMDGIQMDFGLASVRLTGIAWLQDEFSLQRALAAIAVPLTVCLWQLP